MKKTLLAVMLVASIRCFAQEKTQKTFCELVGTGKLFSNKVTITVDFGQETSFWTGYSNQYLVDEEGKAIKFNSMVDAMNFMGKLGWEFEQAYVVSTSSQNVYHWLLSKEIVEGEEQTEGIMTRKMHNNQYESEEPEDNTPQTKRKNNKKIADDIYY